MSGAADQADADEQRQIEQAFRPHKYKGEHQAHDRRAEQRRKNDPGRGPVKRGDPAGGDLIESVAGGRDQQQQDRRIGQFAAGADDQQGAGEPDQHRTPASDADPLAEQRHRHRGDQQRRCEADRRRRRQRDPPDRHDKDEVADQHQEGAAELDRRPPGREQAPPVARQEHRQHDDQVPGEPRPDDLRDRVVRSQELDRGVHEREHHDAGAHQQDAAQQLGRTLAARRRR